MYIHPYSTVITVPVGKNFHLGHGRHGISACRGVNGDLKHELVGGIPTPLKNISQIGSSSQLLGKIKNVPNHQPVRITMEENHGGKPWENDYHLPSNWIWVVFQWFTQQFYADLHLIYSTQIEWLTEEKKNRVMYPTKIVFLSDKSGDLPNNNGDLTNKMGSRWEFSAFLRIKKRRGLWLIQVVTSHECRKGPPNDSLVGLDIYSEMGLYSQLLAGMSSCWACHFWWENPTWKCANKWFTYCPVGSWLELHSGLADSHTWAKFASKLSVSVCCVWYSDFPRIIEYNYTYNSLHTLWYSDFVW